MCIYIYIYMYTDNYILYNFFWKNETEIVQSLIYVISLLETCMHWKCLIQSTIFYIINDSKYEHTNIESMNLKKNKNKKTKN